MSTAFNKFNQFVEDLAKKVHNLDSDVIKVMLTNTAPVATNTVKANITEIAAGNGYTVGGGIVAFVSGAQTAGLYKLILAALTFTAAGGVIGPFRYAVFYNSTTASGNLIGWYDYGSANTIPDGSGFTVNCDQTNGVLQLQ